MSTAASVSRFELKERNDEIAPRVTGAVSTGTISAAACRAFSFSRSAALLVPGGFDAVVLFAAPP